MAKRYKQIERMRRNPNNVRFEDLDRLLLSLGFAKRQRGSHAGYTLDTHFLVIPFRKPFVLPIYVKRVLAILDEIESSDVE